MLLSFLKNLECDNLYIVGDLIDIWVMRSLNQWTQDHTDIIQKILKKSKHHSVFYSPGNHDEFFKQFYGNNFGNCHIDCEFVYESISGKKYLITHGDLYDSLVYNNPALAKFVSNLYEKITNINHKLNLWLIKKNKSTFNISAWVKLNFKRYVKHVTDFENKLVLAAKKQNCQGVICGHIHLPCIKNSNNIEYINCGDWVENCTALVEHLNGEMEIIKII